MLAATTLLAPNFTAHELRVDRPEATDVIVANARRVAAWLQVVRGILGTPVLVTSGFRTPAENTATAGSDTSDHLRGLAADFKGQGLTGFDVYQKLRAARAQLPLFDQLIYYAVDNHVHVGLGERMRGEVLIKTLEGDYVQAVGKAVANIRGYL